MNTGTPQSTIGPENARQIFASGFEGTTRLEATEQFGGQPQMAGTDIETGYSWDGDANPFDGNLRFVMPGNDDYPDAVGGEITQTIGPDGTPTQVLDMFVGNPNDAPVGPFPDRGVTALLWKSPPDEAYSKVWVKIEDTPDNFQTQHSLQTWKDGETFIGAEGSVHAAFRMNLTLVEADGKVQFRFAMEDIYQTEDGGRSRDTTLREELGEAPLGEWMMLETAYKKGDDGYLWIAVNGETLIEFHGRTQAIEPSQTLEHWTLMQVYKTSPDDADSTVLFDNYEIWDGIPTAEQRAAFLAEGNLADALDGDAVAPEATDGDDNIDGGAGDDLIKGLAGDDKMFAGGGNDTLFGNSGADTLIGGSGSDLISGASGTDQLHGNGGSDRLWGGDGDDLLGGYEGRDLLDGGSGADTFIFRSGDGHDIIFDFENDLDRIQFNDGVAGFDALAIRQRGEDIEVSYDGGSITILDEIIANIEVSDFLF